MRYSALYVELAYFREGELGPLVDVFSPLFFVWISLEVGVANKAVQKSLKYEVAVTAGSNNLLRRLRFRLE